MLHIRLKDEFTRLGLKISQAASAAGESDSQGLRDVLGGRKRLSAELLAALEPLGVDVAYILTGKRSLAATTASEQMLLEGFRAMDEPTKKRLLAFVLTGDQTPVSEAKPTQSARVIVGRDIVKGGFVLNKNQDKGK